MKTYKIVIKIKGREEFELENDSKEGVEEMAYDIINNDLSFDDYVEISIKQIKK